MGSGKTSVGKYLKEKLPDSAGLDLDLNANDEVISLNEVLGRGNVVGELYDGGSHTTNPTWINKFKEKEYNIISVILNANLKHAHTGLRRFEKTMDQEIMCIHIIINFMKILNLFLK